MAKGFAGLNKLVIGVEKSINRKVGAVSATYVSQASCPNTCTFANGGGCYANSGGPLGGITNNLNRTNPNVSSMQLARAESVAIDKLTGERPLRLHVVGDCKTNGAARMIGAAVTRYIARFQQRAWTYTHSWATITRQAWGSDISVLASCENTRDAHNAMSRGYAVALVTMNHPDNGRAYELDHLKVIPCPAQTRNNVNCASCRLCWDDSRLLNTNSVIAFAAHGTGTKRAKARLAQSQ